MISAENIYVCGVGHVKCQSFRTLPPWGRRRMENLLWKDEANFTLHGGYGNISGGDGCTLVQNVYIYILQIIICSRS